MAITEDASTPAIVQVPGAAGACTTASFSPPANSLLLALVAGGWGNAATTTASITDSAGGVWTPAVTASGTNGTTFGVAKIFYRYLPTAPGAITVSATFANLSGGRFLAVRVLNNAAATQTGGAVGTQINSVNTTAGTVGITTTVTGSQVYGVSDDCGLNDAYNANGSTSILTGTPTGDYNDTTDQVRLVAWKATSATGTPGATTLGGAWAGATRSNIAAFEVLPFTAATFQGAAALSGASALTASVTVTEQASAGLVASSALGSSAGLPAAAAGLVAVSALAAAGARVQPAAAALTAISTVVAGPFVTEQAAAALPATSTLVVDGRTVKVGGVSLASVSGLTAAALVGPSAQLAATSTLTAAVGVQTMAVAVALAGTSGLSPAAGLVAQAAAMLQATSSLVAQITLPAEAQLAATSTLGVAPFLVEQAAVGLSAVGQLSATGQLTEVTRAALAATSSLGITGPLLITGGTGALLVATSGLTAAATSYVPAFVWPTGTVVHRVRTPTYRLYAANTRTGRIGWELPFDSVSWNTPINATGTLRATLPIESTLDALHTQGARDPRTTLREVLTGPYLNSLVLTFGDAAVFAGPYLPAAVPADTPTVDIGAAELVAMFDKRLLYTPGAVAMADPASDLILGPTSGPGLIKAIIDAATWGVGYELPITCSNPPDLRGSEQRIFYGFDLTTAGSALSQLTAQGLQDLNQPLNQAGGPDYRLDPYLRQAADGLYVSWELRIGNPYLGENIAPWVFDDATSLVSQEIDASKMASVYYVPGSGTDRVKLISVAWDDSLMSSGWPALEEVDGAYTSELDPVRLQTYANADIARYLQPVDKWTIKTRVDQDPQLGSFRVGDPMLLDIQRHPVINPGIYARRITEIAGDASAWVSLSSTEARPEL